MSKQELTVGSTRVTYLVPEGDGCRAIEAAKRPKRTPWQPWPARWSWTDDAQAPASDRRGQRQSPRSQPDRLVTLVELVFVRPWRQNLRTVVWFAIASYVAFCVVAGFGGAIGTIIGNVVR